MATKTGGRLVTRGGLSEVFGVSMPTIDTWVRAGCPFVERGGRGKEWRFDTAAVAKWREQKAATDATGDTQADEAGLKKRRLIADTRRAELALAMDMREVGTIANFERAQAAIFAQIRANVMNVPQRVVTQLLGEKDETKFKSKLRAELVLALEASATADMDLADDEETDPEGAQ